MGTVLLTHESESWGRFAWKQDSIAAELPRRNGEVPAKRGIGRSRRTAAHDDTFRGPPPPQAVPLPTAVGRHRMWTSPKSFPTAVASSARKTAQCAVFSEMGPRQARGEVPAKRGIGHSRRTAAHNDMFRGPPPPQAVPLSRDLPNARPMLTHWVPSRTDGPVLAEDLFRRFAPPSPKGKASPPDCSSGVRTHCGWGGREETLCRFHSLVCAIVGMGVLLTHNGGGQPQEENG